jgi:uncharacterized protein with HEPN domain
VTEVRDLQSLVDIRERCMAIDRATRGNPGSIQDDEVVAAAVLYHLHVIGEATTPLSDEFRKRHPEIGWSGWRGFRIVSTHHYDKIDLGRVQKQMERALPLLLALVEQELA